jgi:predicted RNA-binding protein YlqC (UPF0109 family)
MHRNFQSLLEGYARIIAKPLCSYPSLLEAEVAEKGHSWLVDYRDYADCDKPAILGSGGRILQALRTCLQSFGKRDGEDVIVKLSEPIIYREPKPPTVVIGWSKEDDTGLALLTAQMLECLPHYTGKVLARNMGDHTLIEVTSDCLTTEVFSAVSLLMKAASRRRGRKCDVRIAQPTTQTGARATPQGV